MFIYEVYISSFCDTNNDGIGDINGIISKLQHFKEIGVDAIWITPFYPSPLVDNGYDISDYKKVDPRYGNLESFVQLTNQAHELGIKIFVDVVYNHSSDKHEWFEKSEQKIEPYTAFYYWFDEPQNDWESFFGGKAFSYSETRKQYYLHRFAPQQPDLNLSNQIVIDELVDTLNYWIELGVDGFRYDVLNFWICDPNKIKTQTQKNTDVRIDDPSLKETFKQIKSRLNKEVVCIGEIGSEDIEVLNSYISEDLMDMVFNFNIGSISELDLVKLTEELKKSPNPTMLFSSHDMMRMHTRLAKGNKQISRLLFELLINYGKNYVVYQGDELLIDDFIPQTIDEVSDFQAVNKFNELIKNGMLEEVAFETVKKDIRDYSRKLVNWNNQTDEKFIQIVKERKTCDITESGHVTNVELIENVLCFTKEYNTKQKQYTLNFNDSAKKVIYENKTYLLDPYGVFKGEK